MSVPVVPVLPVRFKSWKEREEEEEIERGRGRGSVQSGAEPTPHSDILRRNFEGNFTAKSAKSSEEVSELMNVNARKPPSEDGAPDRVRRPELL